MENNENFLMTSSSSLNLPEINSSLQQSKKYVCNLCYKSYGTNAALFTHNKRKHDGISSKQAQTRKQQVRMEIETQQDYQQTERYLERDNIIQQQQQTSTERQKEKERQYLAQDDTDDLSILQKFSKIFKRSLGNIKQAASLNHLYDKISPGTHLKIVSSQFHSFVQKFQHKTFKGIFQQLLIEIDQAGFTDILKRVHIIIWIWYMFQKGNGGEKRTQEPMYSISNLNRLVLEWIPKFIEEIGEGGEQWGDDLELTFLETDCVIQVVFAIHKWVAKEYFSEHRLKKNLICKRILQLS